MSQANPTLLFTVMKNEGPFILEWIAYHRAIGIDKFLVFTNDCDDGTDDILYRLDDLGIVRHVPNPAAMGTKYVGKANHPHIVGLTYAKLHREWHEAEWIYFSDVDEFLDIYAGDGTLDALIEGAGNPDIISISEKIFGAGLNEKYREGFITDQFTRCTSASPGRWRARKGIKSLCRNRPEVIDVRNHRPLLDKKDAMDVKWVDGAGADVPEDFRIEHVKGMDVRGRYGLGAVNHYTLRSFETFLCKVDRGDAVAQYEDRLDWIYFKRRNRLDDENTHIQRMKPAMQEQYDALMADETLSRLHYRAVRHHRAKIHRLRADPRFDDLWAKMIQSKEDSAKFIDWRIAKDAELEQTS